MGSAYNQTLAGTGGYGSYFWQVYYGILPMGLSLDGASGVLSGVPLEATCGTIVIAVSDEEGRTTYKDFKLQVAEPLQILTTSLPNALKDSPLSEAIRVRGGVSPITFSYTGQLPAGLSLNTATGVISGTISYDAAAGSPCAVTVRVEDPGGLFHTDTFTWAVAPTTRPPPRTRQLQARYREVTREWAAAGGRRGAGRGATL